MEHVFSNKTCKNISPPGCEDSGRQNGTVPEDGKIHLSPRSLCKVHGTCFFKQNLKKHKLSGKTKFYVRSVDDIYSKKFDLVVSNPPYIMKKDLKNLQDDIKKFEHKLALDGGNDGLDVIKKVIYKSKYILKIKGTLALEIGNEQFKKVSKILRSNKFKTKYLVKDYRENIRCILSTLEK